MLYRERQAPAHGPASVPDFRAGQFRSVARQSHHERSVDGGHHPALSGRAERGPGVEVISEPHGSLVEASAALS